MGWPESSNTESQTRVLKFLQIHCDQQQKTQTLGAEPADEGPVSSAENKAPLARGQTGHHLSHLQAAALSEMNSHMSFH